MRQGQQKRMRGRSRGGKGPNPLSRSYESNGPDVKVRGTAAHIAEKYVQLARDAQSSGDPILAESYLQHAEHYFRIIAAAQPQFTSDQNFGHGAEDEEDGDDADFEGPIPSMPQGFGTPANQFGGSQGFDEQPRLVQPGRDRNFGERGEGGQPYREREHRFRDRNDRFNGERGPREERQPREDRQSREDRPYREERQRDRQFDGQANGQAAEGEGGGEPRFNQRHGRRDRRFGDRGDRPFRDRANAGDGPLFSERGQGERGAFQPAPVVPVDQPQPDLHDDHALSTLPSFITGTPAVASAAPAAAPAPVQAVAAPVEATPTAAPAAAEAEAEAAAPRPRKRRVSKKAAAASETAEASAETASE